MNGTCPDREKLLLHMEGELSDAEATEVAAHVARCADCAEAVSELTALTSALRAAGGTAETSASTRQRVRSAWSPGESCPGEAIIAGYVDGSLASGTAADVERHVASCSSCLAEVADLWSMAGPGDHDAPDGAVARVLARLDAESRTAVLRWAERSLELVRDFASGLVEDINAGLGPGREPAVAASRSSTDEVRLHWNGRGGAALAGIVRRDGAGTSLTGRVTITGDPAVSTSASLSAASGTRGPESLDADGRFGPWPLSDGENVLRLTGLPGGDCVAELVVRLDASEDGSG